MRIVDKYGDLFLDKTSMKCQCISSDLAMGAGIATKFNEHYNVKHKLENDLNLNKNQLARIFQKSNGFCIYYDNVFNLVTKEKCYEKPSYENIAAALEDMARCAGSLLEMGLLPNKKIAMPEIGCGLDKLEWEKVRTLVEKVFKDLPIEINVWHFNKDLQTAKDQPINMKNPGFEIKTGYFAMTKRYEEAGYYPVSIARFTPQRVVCGNASTFAPPEDLLNDYKKGAANDTDYNKRYISHLNKIPAVIWDKFAVFYEQKCRMEGFKGIVLMCYEKPEDMCHRHLWADYVLNRFGTRVTEFTIQKKFEEEKVAIHSLSQEEYER